MPLCLSPVSVEALKTIALVLHGEEIGSPLPLESRDLVAHVLLAVRESEGPLEPDEVCRWLEEKGRVAPEQARAIRGVAARVAESGEVSGLGRSPLSPNLLEIWSARAEGREDAPFDRVLEALEESAA